MSDSENPSIDSQNAATLPTPPDDPATPTSNRKALWITLGVIAAVILAFGIWKVANTVTVPQVVGLSQAAAMQKIADASLKVGRVSEEATIAFAPGTVFAQSPVAESKAAKNSAVDLKVAIIPVASVPDVVGGTESEAEAELAAEGLRMGAVTGVFSEKKAGTVLSQTPVAGTEVAVASMVDLEISLGAKVDAVPDVVGLTSSDAVEVLDTAGFTSSEAKSTSTDVEAGRVISQSPGAGTVVEAESNVKITVSTGAPAPAAPADTPTPPSAEPTAPAPEPAPTPEPTATPKPDPKPEPPATKPEVATVPDIIGSRVLEALRALSQANLTAQIEWGPTEDGYLKIIAQDPKAGTEVDPGTVVTMTIGLPEFLFSEPEVQPLPSTPGTPSTPETPSIDQGSDVSSETTP